jgi:uncharacterized protein HemX
MSNPVEGGQRPEPVSEPPSEGDRPPSDAVDIQGTAPDGKRGAGRRWLLIGMVVLGIVAALAVGYVVGGNSRDDNVESAQAQAAQADKDAASANEDAAAAEQALEEDQAQDEQAVGAINQGVENLGNAIEREETKDDQAAQDAVDEATKEIEGGLEEIAADASENVSKALADLKAKINDAVGSRSAGDSQSTGD